MKFRPNADLMASVFVHLMLLALIFLYSEVHQFDPVAADTVPVEIVTPQEVAKSEVETKPEPAPSPSPTPELQLPSLDKPVDSAKPEPSAQAPAPQQNAQQQPQQKQATPPAPKPSPAPQRAAAEPLPTPAQQTPPMPQPTAQQQAAASPPAYAQPEPDLSVKYNVMLGLPPDISVKPPASAPSGLGPGKDNFDAAATEQADVGSSVVAEFRRHLKTCLKLPPTLSAGDDVKIKLRVFMKPDGKLAASPLLIEATASEKGPLLLKSATDALQACQPYAMLPRDRYGEWKVLDLDFSPRDFAS
ncbi:outer membrane biosynthesis protein TonB [Bradyrhizobium sp. USDA 4509]